jgi:HEAT repeat protein
MQTLSVNSKKCSTVNFRTIGVFAAISAISVVSFSIFSNPAQAFQTRPLSNVLLGDIRHSTSPSFNPLLQSWEQKYGTAVVSPLLEVARNKSASDSERYVAVMGIAKIGGKASAPLLSPFLKDSSWMIRNGTLRALTALKHPETSAAVLPLVKDPALVVRLEAVQSVEKLHPEGSLKALLAAIDDSENYHHGKAQWVPQRALLALQHLQTQNEISQLETRETATKLAALLERPKDPALKPQIEATLRHFTESASP